MSGNKRIQHSSLAGYLYIINDRDSVTTGRSQGVRSNLGTGEAEAPAILPIPARFEAVKQQPDESRSKEEQR